MSRNSNLISLAGLMLLLVLPELCHASAGISEFNGPFEKVVGTITGSTGRWIAIFGVATAGGMLIWKKEDPMGAFKMLLSVVFGASFIALAANITDAVFSFSGALL
ncbi:TrbC/VirB2 family protein [Halodesulfovibrio sp.]|jgi:type IV secretion system protein VirB2|uniref:TrbC/VirB2 family protein n=1 Tax=Halodesulfovibrio sp. TaxID=1912772 RepID=UPI0025DC1364|nr:TrbC/VirB2 family protein [Halodesulfovibrio sp.]MCT4625648.1 TrbC/VirB2 family protein [Halodesulfovibrio sp.]